MDAAAKGDTVFLKPGRYEQDITIHSKDRVRLVGAGRDKVTLVGREDLVGVLHVGKWPYGASNIEISDMTINEHGGHAVGLFNGRGVLLKRLTVNGMGTSCAWQWASSSAVSNPQRAAGWSGACSRKCCAIFLN